MINSCVIVAYMFVQLGVIFILFLFTLCDSVYTAMETLLCCGLMTDFFHIILHNITLYNVT